MSLPLLLSLVVVESVLCNLLLVLVAVREVRLHGSHSLFPFKHILLIPLHFRLNQLLFQRFLPRFLLLKSVMLEFLVLLHINEGLLLVIVQILHFLLLLPPSLLNNILQ